ncbi:MAG: ABC transporter permease, partial [Candidatus Aenigmatarchaeota archaeon]
DDRSVMMPLDTARELFNKDDEVSAIYVDTEDTFDVNEVAEDIEDRLEDERGEKDFTVQTMEQVQASVNNILGMVQALFLGVAGISILVGGVGVMNTMYTSVLEKTREIGIMKAVGARNSHIMILFLFESGMMGLIGGVLGVGFGLGLAKVAEFFIQQSFGLGMLEAAVTPELILGALGFSFGIGTLSGLFPARKASRLNPVDALRYE